MKRIFLFLWIVIAFSTSYAKEENDEALKVRIFTVLLAIDFNLVLISMTPRYLHQSVTNDMHNTSDIS